MRRYRLLLRLIGAVLLASFVAVTWVQWRQVKMLHGTLQTQDDYLVWSLFQLETEYLRLRAELQRAVDRPGRFDRDALQLRYDIFVSRVGIVEMDRVKVALRVYAPYHQLVIDLNAFIRQADRHFGASEPQALSPQSLADVLAELDRLKDSIHDFSLNESHHVSQLQASRNAAVRVQGQLGIALAAFQGVLTLLFAGVAIRQLRELMRQRQEQDALVINLHSARLDAEAANRAKTVFLANMSHEIRTPFHGLLGMLALLGDTPLTARQRDYLGTARDSARHLLSILNDVLDISRIESDNLQIVDETVDLPGLIHDVEQLMRTIAVERGLTLAVRIDSRLPRHVRVDPMRLKQILFNLLSNALKFCEQGGVTLHASAAPAAGAATATLRVAVSDTGIGMDEATLERLFKRFSQGDETTSRRFGGTGLGLQISRSLAQLMGGDIEVSSSPGQGSTFVLRIPCTPAAAPETQPSGAPAIGAARPPALRICVAEDHAVNRKYVAALLDKLGHTARFCVDGREAVEALRQEPFDLILMDLHMPGMDGLAATVAIRALPAPNRDVLIVALTADAFEATRRRVLSAGMNDFLAKPIGQDELEQMLTRHFGSAAPVADTPAADTLVPPAPAGGASLFDDARVAELREVLGVARAGEVTRMFFGDQARSLTQLSDAVAAGDRDGTRAYAHALRGAALNLGLKAVAERALELEVAARDGRMHKSAALAQALRLSMADTRSACTSGGLFGS